LTNYVLIPGAWLGGWAWNRVVPLLESEGHTAFPVTLTGMGDRVHLATKDVGMETAIRDVVNVIEYNGIEDFVLVGHSFAGKVASVAADREHSKVRSVLFLDAFRPANVRTPQGGFDVDEFGPLAPGASSVPLSDKIVETIGKDLSPADRNWLMSKSTPWPTKHATDPITLSEDFDSIKRAYILCTGGGDSVEEIVAGKWGKLEGPYKVIDSGHWPMITKPQELVRDILELSE